jgi:hemerythrin-like metal-binding protein
MATLTWTDTLALDFPPMDDMHRRFVEALAEVEACRDTELPKRWEDLISQTRTFFETEDRWMKSTDFSSAPNHTLQHRVVLNVMREGLGMARSGQMSAVRNMARELACWFAKHIQSLDAALALHMRRQDPIPA